MSLCDFSIYWLFIAMCAAFLVGFVLSSLAARSDASNSSLEARRLELERSFAEQRQLLLSEALQVEAQKTNWQRLWQALRRRRAKNVVAAQIA